MVGVAGFVRKFNLILSLSNSRAHGAVDGVPVEL